MKRFLLITLLLMQACSGAKQDSSKQSAAIVTGRSEKKRNTGIKELSQSQKKQIKLLLPAINAAVIAYKNDKDPSEIAAKCDKVTADVEELTLSLPDGFFKNTLQQGSDALNLAYKFRFEKVKDITISPELRKQVIDVYKIGDIKEADRADKIFNFAQVHFDIVARLAADVDISK